MNCLLAGRLSLQSEARADFSVRRQTQILTFGTEVSFTTELSVVESRVSVFSVTGSPFALPTHPVAARHPSRGDLSRVHLTFAVSINT